MSHFPILPIIVLIIWVLRAFARARPDGAGRPPGPLPPRRTIPPNETEAERQRRFREAVGLPLDAPLPPPVRPRANPAPLLPVNPPKGYAGMPGRLRRVPAAGPPARPQTAARSIPPPRPPTQAPVGPPPMLAPPSPLVSLALFPQSDPVPLAPAVAPPAVQPSYPAKGLLVRLRDPGAIREAIILREILGPPKAPQQVLPGLAVMER